MYNMHMLDKIIIHVYRNVHNLISETLIYMTSDVEHNETTPTIHFIFVMKISKSQLFPKLMRRYTSYNQDMEMFIYIKMDAECNKTTHAISFPRVHEDS